MISLFNMIGNEKKNNTFGLMTMFEGMKDAILPIVSNTPYGSAARIIKEHGGDFTREVGEGVYHDLFPDDSGCVCDRGHCIDTAIVTCDACVKKNQIKKGT